MSDLLQLTFGRNAILRGDSRLKRVRHDEMSVAIEQRESVGLIVNLSGAHRIEGHVDGRFHSSVPRPASISVLPPSSRCRMQIKGRCSVLILRLGWQNILDGAAQAGLTEERIAIPTRINNDDPSLARLVFRAAGDAPFAFEAAIPEIVGHLVASSTPMMTRHRSIGLAGSVLRRVRELCRDSGPSLPRLADLANEVGMSQYHFARSFKLATGFSPHQYLLRCRTEKAMDLLARTRLSVTAVAGVAGFAHPSHLARHVRRVTGLAPEAYRRQILP